MKSGYLAVLLAAALGGVMPLEVLAQAPTQATVDAANQINGLEVSQQGGAIYLRVALKSAPAVIPASFSVANPARIAFDFPSTANGLGRTVQNVDEGDLRSLNIVQVGDRTRLVLNLTKIMPYEAKVDGNNVVIALNPVQRSREASSSNPASPVSTNRLVRQGVDLEALAREIGALAEDEGLKA